MKWFLLGALLFAGCVTPSTMLVNRDGKVMRCATSGYGYGIMGAVAMSAAQQTHDRCVADAKLVGFVEIPRVQLGLLGDTKKVPMPIVELAGNAKDSGLAIGDLVLALDDKQIGGMMDVIVFLNGKQPGDRVNVKVRRQDQELVYPVTVAPR